jgi:hypothetical protein
MDSTPHPNPPGPSALSPDLYYQAVDELARALPASATDSSQDRARRQAAAIDHVAALQPANADEVVLACQYIAAAAQALDCLRLARQFPDDAAHVLKCTAQAGSMMRQSRGARAQLARLRQARQDRTLSKPSGQPAAPPEPGAEATAAEKYALENPSKAALIRSLGRLPKKFDDPTVTPALIHQLVTGNSPILQALVKKPAHRLAA